ncbi:DUF4422 domain-containing protein [Rhizobium sp. LC145]|uniref:DUF4422 domain-containing protein n=1 Tax=Rhizobium sp. LC145 TaxID=1120688 RepID=UPI0006995BE9|nr:DUF4422 domain-containing protein [Rhizobium sp. LC145]TKT55925.1 DUF4422 domain-containing protein [Rhizobiaceae bacterium LC148]
MITSIYVAEHKECAQLKGNSFIPIHVGRRGKAPTFCELGDDTGDNISGKNDSFCELTALYWIWKNTKDQDYVGLFHYRRHLRFSTNEAYEDQWGLVQYERIDDRYIEDNNLTDSGVSYFINDFDIILPKLWDVRNAGSISLEDHYRKAPHQHISDYETALQIIREKYPDYGKFIDTINRTSAGYFTNMFVMRREIYNKYCEWLFDVLFELEKRIDISSYSTQERRIFGFISEWLFNIFISKLLADQPELKVKEAQRTFVISTTPATPSTAPEAHKQLDFLDALHSLKHAPRDIIRYARRKIRSISPGDTS